MRALGSTWIQARLHWTQIQCRRSTTIQDHFRHDELVNYVKGAFAELTNMPPNETDLARFRRTHSYTIRQLRTWVKPQQSHDGSVHLGQTAALFPEDVLRLLQANRQRFSLSLPWHVEPCLSRSAHAVRFPDVMAQEMACQCRSGEDVEMSGRLFSRLRVACAHGCGSKLNGRGYVHVSTCQGSILGTGFLSHSHIAPLFGYAVCSSSTLPDMRRTRVLRWYDSASERKRSGGPCSCT